MNVENATSVYYTKEVKSENGFILDSCRLCMEKNKNMKDIFDAKHSELINMVQYCTGLQLTHEEGLPTHICHTCELNLQTAHKFKATCLMSDEKFRRHIITTVKIEEANSEFDSHFVENADNEDDCKDILKEVLKLTDIKISRVRLKKEKDRPENRPRKKRQIIPKECNKDGARAYKIKNTVQKAAAKKQRTINLQCDLCKIEFKTKEESVDHKKTVHKEIESYICEICGRTLSSRASLYSHMQSHLPPRHACDRCDYKTWHKHDLVKHRSIHTGIKMFQCEFCTASYHTSSNLRYHIRLHHEGAPKRFECKLCERSFYDRSKLRRHLDAHNDIKRYECEVCHSCFTRRCYWKKHLSRQHGVVIPATRPGRQKMNLLIADPSANVAAPPSGYKTDVT